MASPPRFVATDLKRVIGELKSGREIADQLRLMLRGHDAITALPARGLVGKVLDSFTRSISILSGEVSQTPASEGLKFDDSGEICKRPSAQKDRRGRYKRRKTSETWIKESSTLFEDGHAWRKYGQKVILNAKHPRNYFRCTHKFDQGCQASKQVQMTRDDPPLYRTTYHGQHSCKNLINSSSSRIIDAATQDNSSVIWSFGTSQPEGHYRAGDGDSVIDVPAENKGEDKSVILSPIYNQLGAAFSSGSVGDVLSSDVYSCTTSTHNMGMEIDLDSVFGDCLEFESLP
ncbi:hypothetical protein CASFOL_000622 [Castilleja foliolosa]|uniref:WRKY domain-containing protein n=1 Tax=Castilleja foliolosa TaxID=1961234 RepID=A0ABD3ENI5_9LAMI